MTTFLSFYELYIWICFQKGLVNCPQSQFATFKKDWVHYSFVYQHSVTPCMSALASGGVMQDVLRDKHVNLICVWNSGPLRQAHRRVHYRLWLWLSESVMMPCKHRCNSNSTASLTDFISPDIYHSPLHSISLFPLSLSLSLSLSLPFLCQSLFFPTTVFSLFISLHLSPPFQLPLFPFLNSSLSLACTIFAVYKRFTLIPISWISRGA